MTLAVGFLTALRLCLGVEGAWPAIVTDVGERAQDLAALSDSRETASNAIALST